MRVTRFMAAGRGVIHYGWLLMLAGGCASPQAGFQAAAVAEATADRSRGSRPVRAGAPEADADVLLDWNRIAYEIAYAEDRFLTFKGQRALAMMNLAMHDALNTIEPRFERYAYRGAATMADAELAAAQAARDVLRSQYPNEGDRLDSALAAVRDATPAGPAREAALELGAAAARAILRVREADRWDAPGSYAFAAGAGRYQTTPDWDGFVLQPGFRSARPFAIDSIEAFRPPPPPDLSSRAYADAYEEVKAYGAIESGRRTADQTGYAVWWMEFSEGSVLRLARRLVAERSLGLWQATRLFAHLAVSLFDGYVANWDSKYEYDHWRPYTAIRSAADDGNDATAPDTTWRSLLPAPPFPEYASAHATGCAAAFAVLAAAFGDDTAFGMNTITAPAEMPTRSFSSFSQAASECADSRIRLGWHFRYSTDAGLALGERVAGHVLRTQLRPRAGEARRD